MPYGFIAERPVEKSGPNGDGCNKKCSEPRVEFCLRLAYKSPGTDYFNNSVCSDPLDLLECRPKSTAPHCVGDKERRANCHAREDNECRRELSGCNRYTNEQVGNSPK